MTFIYLLRREMETGDVEGFMERLQSFFSGISYEMRLEEERNVQNAMLVLFRLMGMQTEVEYRTSRGRIDILVRTDRYVYVMELKFNGTAEEALRQIKDKDYRLPWSADTRRTISIGMNYSTATRSLNEWIAE